MALDSTPWFVGGGAHHSPEVARLLAYASTSGAEGIVEPASLRVSAQSTPNGTVSVRPGAALILNKYAGGGQQTYVLRNASSTSVTIPATSSTGGRTDAIVARVLDPQYEGATPADPVTFQYSKLERIAGVSSNLTNISQLGLTYPAVLLARINIPASTGTITSGMITDLREVAIPRRQTELRTYALTAADKETLASTLAYPRGETFPNAGNIWGAIYIPSWATRMKILMSWTGIMAPAGNAFGGMWVQVGQTADPGHKSSQYVSYDTPNSSGNSRMPHLAADNMHVPVAMRGTSQYFHPYGNVNAATAAASRIFMDAGSSLVLQVEFAEQAD